MTTAVPYYLAGTPTTTGQDGRQLIVVDKYSGEAAYAVALADRKAVDAAIAAAVRAASAMRQMPAHRRQAVLLHVVKRLHERHEELAQLMCIEAGKPIKDSRGEVTRAIDTFKIAAEESLRIKGEYLPLDISQRAEGYEGFVKRVPIGPCSFITPFNFPLNLVAHKVAPAIAAGCPFVLKPAPQAPVSAIRLAEILAETDLPTGSFSVVPCEIEDAALLVEDDRIKLLSFTCSSAVGWALKSKAGKKKVLLELGGNAGCIVDCDADIDHAVARIVIGAFYQSGQSCISVQRLFVHSSIYEELKSRLVDEAQKLKPGDPRDEGTFLGPLISERDVQRINEWVKEAQRAGAKVLCGGNIIGSRFFEATIVENAPATSKLYCEEVFGPVLTIQSFDEFDDAIRMVNDSRYGLQAGVFTRDLSRAMRAWNEIETGGVVINDVPSIRVDSMPYGGVKDSGLGREGVAYTINEMTELRLLVLRNTGW